MAVVGPALLRLMLRHQLARNVVLGPEERISIEFADRCRANVLEGRLRATWWHTGNELAGHRKSRLAAIRYAIAEAMGLIPGAPDFVFLWGGGCLVIEVKAGRNGQSDRQTDFQTWCTTNGVQYYLARSADDGEAILRAAGILLDRRVA